MGSLNEDPYNLCAEQLAMDLCIQAMGGARRTWSEKDMVCSFGGALIPGTPDGMFEDFSGSLVCVQVVRVPMLPDMSQRAFADVLYETVLTKVAKSQAWMKATRTMPSNFIIFCWLPPCAASRPNANFVSSSRGLFRLDAIVHHIGAVRVSEQSSLAWRCRALTQRVRSFGWPFSLYLALAASPGSIFPARFGKNRGEQERGVLSEEVLFPFCADDFESECDEAEWNLFDLNFEEELESGDEEADELPFVIEQDMGGNGEAAHNAPVQILFVQASSHRPSILLLTGSRPPRPVLDRDAKDDKDGRGVVIVNTRIQAWWLQRLGALAINSKGARNTALPVRTRL